MMETPGGLAQAPIGQVSCLFGRKSRGRPNRLTKYPRCDRPSRRPPMRVGRDRTGASVRARARAHVGPF